MKKTQLFLLHFAGGSSYSYDFIKPYLHDFEIIQLELPGRGRRMDEALILDFNVAAQDLFQQILKRITSASFFVYGHSMGAYLALKIVSMLEKVNKRASYLIVSGNAGPGINEPVKRYLLDKHEFRKELKRIGGIPNEFFSNVELLEFYEPILRADFQISEEGDFNDVLPVNTPLFAIMGDEEEKVKKISNWANFTKLNFDYHIFPGDHFFIREQPAGIADILRNCKKKTTYFIDSPDRFSSKN